VDGQKDEYEKIFSFSHSMGFPTRLSHIHATLADVDTMIEKALSGIDVRQWPYPVTPKMIADAVDTIEADNDAKGIH
ncbi:MAG: hypothetical protein PHN26_04530, partial [Eubacteriaceae bacterium]|nr:hypothetical protein [Eubacteriaceae bacterium]